MLENLPLRVREEDYINIQPIQRGGVLTPEARKALIVYGDGYSVCDYCFKPFRLDYIKKPDIQSFVSELAEFLNMEKARVVRGARNGFQIVMNSLLDKGDIVLVSSLAHYSLCLAVEASGGEWREIPVNQDNILTPESVVEKIEYIKKKEGKPPKLVAVHHVDYQFGNLHPVKEIAKVCHEYDIPILLNGAYTVGIMPVDGKELGVDFIVGSGHKSMAAPSPIGVLATTQEYAKILFRSSERKGDITNRNFGIKEVELLGCTVMGAPLIGLMASFPYVRERVKHWDEELEKINYFAREFLKIEGNEILSEMPRKHTLTKVNTTKTFGKVGEKHKRKGFFFTDELKKRKIVGLFPGSTKTWKLNTYGLTWKQVKYLINALKEIAMKYNIPVIG